MSKTLARMHHVQKEIQKVRGELSEIDAKHLWNEEDHNERQNELERQHSVLQQKRQQLATNLHELYQQWAQEEPECASIRSALPIQEDVEDQARLEDLPELEDEPLPNFLRSEDATSETPSEEQ